MTYLQLCQEVVELAAISKVPGLPLSVNGQINDIGRVVKYVNQAWVDIQTLNDDWKFMWAESSVNDMIAGQSEYLMEPDGKSLIADSMVVLNGQSERSASYVGFNEFRSLYGRNPTQEGIPKVCTVTPGNKISFYPIPDSAYQFYYDYYTLPASLSADDDEPSIDARYRMAIAYLALKRFGEYKKNGDLVTIGEAEYQKLLTQISNEYLPEINLPGAFV